MLGTVQSGGESAAISMQGKGVPVADFGDARAEFRALLNGCGIYELSDRGVIVLRGNDRVRWLNGMVTNNIRDLGPGHGAYAFLLNPQGRILGDLHAYNRGDDLLLETSRNQLEKLLPIFDHYIIMDDVEVSDASETRAAIGLAGPKAEAVLKAAGIETKELGPLEFRETAWGSGVKLTVVRGEQERHPSYEIWIAPENCEALWKTLLQSGATATGTTALEWHRIALGVPRYGVDIRERDLPQETEQTRALNFNKGCYVGQEIVERIRSRGAVHRTFTGFVVEGPMPAPGTRLQLDGKDVAEITSAASLPHGDDQMQVALGYVRRDVGSPGKELTAGGRKAKVSPLPFEVLWN
jgi:aminomethyltransferase